MKRLFKLLVFAGIVTAAYKFIAAQKAEWQGLTESEVRAKLEHKLSDRVPEEKLGQIQDNVVTKMREMGKLAEEPAPAEPEAEDAAETA